MNSTTHKDVRSTAPMPLAPTGFRRISYNLAHDWRRHRALFLMILPGVIWFLVFKYAPMYGALIGFKNYSPFLGFWKSPWAGTKYFEQFLNDPYFFRLLRNTLLLGLYNLIWGFPAPILLAIFINELKGRYFKKFTQTVTYIPYFISIVIVVGILMNMLASDGIVNTMIRMMGGKEIIFLNEPKLFRTIYIASDIWQSMGYGSIVYLAAITGIDPQLYEAGKIDGASRVQSVFHITLPSITSTILVLMILRLGSIINVGFEKVFLLQSAATLETGDVISTYVFRKWSVDRSVSYAAAVDLFNSVISMTLLVAANTASRKLFDQGVW